MNCITILELKFSGCYDEPNILSVASLNVVALTAPIALAVSALVEGGSWTNSCFSNHQKKAVPVKKIEIT